MCYILSQVSTVWPPGVCHWPWGRPCLCGQSPGSQESRVGTALPPSPPYSSGGIDLGGGESGDGGGGEAWRLVGVGPTVSVSHGGHWDVLYSNYTSSNSLISHIISVVIWYTNISYLSLFSTNQLWEIGWKCTAFTFKLNIKFK